MNNSTSKAQAASQELLSNLEERSKKCGWELRALKASKASAQEIEKAQEKFDAAKLSLHNFRESLKLSAQTAQKSSTDFSEKQTKRIIKTLEQESKTSIKLIHFYDRLRDFAVFSDSELDAYKFAYYVTNKRSQEARVHFSESLNCFAVCVSDKK